MSKHQWYGPEHYREPTSHVSAAIQWPIFPDAASWAERIVNGYVRDWREAQAARTRRSEPEGE